MLKKLFLGLLLSGVVFQEMTALEFSIFFGKAAKDKIAQQKAELDRQKRLFKQDCLHFEQVCRHLNEREEALVRAQEKLQQELDNAALCLKAEKKAHNSARSKFRKALVVVPAAFLVGVIAGGALVFKLAGRVVE